MPAVVPYVEEPTERMLRILKLEAEQIGKSGLLPESLRGPDKLPALMQVGMTAKALGVTNLSVAVSHIHVIEGRPSISAQLAIAVAEVRGGVVWQLVRSDAERCIVRGFRTDWPAGWRDEPTVIEWTIDDARRAGLLDVKWTNYATTPWGEWIEGSDVERPAWARAGARDVKRTIRENWHRYPADMLYARATKRLARALASAALTGLMSAPINLDHDLEDVHIPDGDAPMVDDERGVVRLDGPNVIDVEPVEDEPTVGRERITVTEPPAADEPAPPRTLADEYPDTFAAPDMPWPRRWAAICRRGMVTPEESAAILTWTCDVQLASQVPDDKRADAEQALDAFMAGTLDVEPVIAELRRMAAERKGAE